MQFIPGGSLAVINVSYKPLQVGCNPTYPFIFRYLLGDICRMQFFLARLPPSSKQAPSLSAGASQGRCIAWVVMTTSQVCVAP